MKYELPSTELIVTEENNYLKFGEYLNDMQCDDTTNKLCLDDLEYVKELQQENEKLKAELQLYQGALKREHEAIHRVNDLEERIDKAIDLIETFNFTGKRLPFVQFRIKIKELLRGVINE